MSIDPTETGGPPMDCAETVRALDAFLDGELEAAEQERLEAHLRACDPCRATAVREGHARTALRAQLRSAMAPGTAAGSAPADLRERIHLALVAEQPPAWWRWTSPLRLAALAACAVAVVLVSLSVRARHESIVEDAVRKHARDLPLEVTSATAGPESVAGWLNGKLDFNASPPRFAGPVRLVGARLSHIHDRPAAYVRYEAPRGRFGVFIVDDPDRRFEGGGHAVQAGPETIRVSSARGFSVAVWRRDEIVYSLVSDLQEQEVAHLVEAARVSAGR